MKKIRAAVVGYGNIGRFAVEALEAAPDFEIAGIVRRQGDKNKPAELAPYMVVDDIAKLSDVDVAILSTPTRSCPEYAEKMVAMGINTVDSFDIHTGILDYRAKQMQEGGQGECYFCRMGPRIRLRCARVDAEFGSQGTYLYQLRPGHEHGT